MSEDYSQWKESLEQRDQRNKEDEEKEMLNGLRAELRDIAWKNISTGICISKPDGEILYVNPTEALSHGYEEDDVEALIGQNVSIFAAGDSIHSRNDLIEQRNDYTSRATTNKLKDETCALFELRTRIVRDEEGEPIYFITESRKVIEAKEGESEDLDIIALINIAEIMHLMKEGVFIVDSQMRITTSNESIARILSSDRESLALQKIEDIFEDKDIFHELMGQVQSGEEASTVARISFTGSESKTVNVSVAPKLDQGGNIVDYIFCFNDISELKHVEQRVRELNTTLESKVKELAESNASKNKFFSILGHDLRNDLSTISGHINVLEVYLDSGNTQLIQDRIGLLHKSMGKSTELLRTLLAWARAQDGRYEYKFREDNLYPYVAGEIEAVNYRAEQKGSSVKFESDKNIVATVDMDAISTVLRNLLGNAVKFTENGTIVVKIEQDEQNIRLDISDSGIGMPENIKDNLYKLDANTGRNGTAGEESTGLGLLLAKEFIEGHGGKIDVESVEGEGTTFTIIIPKTQSEKVSRKPTTNT